MDGKRIPNSEHESRPWRIRDIASDFKLEDAWALPVHGTFDEFPRAVQLATSAGPSQMQSRSARALWQFRDLLGKWFGLGRISAAAEDQDPDSLSRRLPEDLRGTAKEFDFGGLPFVPLFRTDDEFAAEVSNKTVHGVMHLSWVPEGDDSYQGQMAVYVKPRGLFGKGYMALIKPFRYAIVYPALMKTIRQRWDTRNDPADGDVRGVNSRD